MAAVASAGVADWHALPNALEKDLASDGRRLVVFLDYDGTLTPIIKDAAAARLSEAMRESMRRLAQRATVAVVSGRAREKIREFVDLRELYYAGSHGFDIDGPGGLKHSVSPEAIPLLSAARDALAARLAGIAGAAVEDNRFSVSVHWRNASARDRPAIAEVVAGLLAEAPYADKLCLKSGKCVSELRPKVEWDKGAAVLFLLDLLRRSEDPAPEADAWHRGILPIYVGDDTTDEDAFRALEPLGALSVLVAAPGDDERPRQTHATHTLRDTEDVRAFLDALAAAAA